VDNITTNGGGPRTDCDYVYQSTTLINPTGNTDFNTLYVGAGPMNLDPIMPVNTAQYTIQLFGKFTGSTSPIQPSPTPTPTPTPTPLVGPCDDVECASYSVTNGNFNPCQFTYWDCLESRYRTILIAPESSYLVNCTCPESFAYECDLVILSSGGCVTPQPCLTCYTVTVTNDSPEDCTYTYYDCDIENYVTVTQPGLTGIEYECICPTISSDCFELNVTQGAYCSGPVPTPTPSPGEPERIFVPLEPTATPTPSPTATKSTFFATTKSTSSLTKVALKSATAAVSTKVGKSLQVTVASVGTKTVPIKVSVKYPAGKSYQIASVTVAKNKGYSAPIIKFAKPGTYVITTYVGTTKRVVTVKVAK
jgi:hypothetical protein